MKKFQPRPGFVVQAYRFALDPGGGQETALRSHCGAARAAYNWAVSWVSASWWQRKAEASYGVPEPEEQLPAGSVGTIVHVFTAPQHAYEVELTNSDGRALATVALTPDQVRPHR